MTALFIGKYSSQTVAIVKPSGILMGFCGSDSQTLHMHIKVPMKLKIPLCVF